MSVTRLPGQIHGTLVNDTIADPYASDLPGQTPASPAPGLVPAAPGCAPQLSGLGSAQQLTWVSQEWCSPWVEVTDFTEVIPTWSAHTPPGTWIEVQTRVGRAGTDTSTDSVSDWAINARWSSGIDYGGQLPDWHSHTLNDQKLHGVRVDADTVNINVTDLGGPANRVQARVLLRAPCDSAGRVLTEFPTVEAITVLTRNPALAGDHAGGTGAEATARVAEVAPHPAQGSPKTTGARGAEVNILLPEFSQRIHGSLPGMGAGDSWCSPTSLAMVEEFWRAGGNPALFPTYAAAEPAAQVPAAVARVWDYAYGGAGNWAFNVAWLATLGFDAYLDSLSGIEELTQILGASEPVIASVRFSKEDLPEAGYETGGHLLVVSGIDVHGDIRVHDPAAWHNNDVRRTYPRAAFERAWLGGSGGLVYRVSCRTNKPAESSGRK